MCAGVGGHRLCLPRGLTPTLLPGQMERPLPFTASGAVSLCLGAPMWVGGPLLPCPPGWLYPEGRCSQEETFGNRGAGGQPPAGSASRVEGTPSSMGHGPGGQSCHEGPLPQPKNGLIPGRRSRGANPARVPSKGSGAWRRLAHPVQDLRVKTRLSCLPAARRHRTFETFPHKLQAALGAPVTGQPRGRF